MDVSAAVAYIMAPKDDKELEIVRKACQATQDLFKNYLRNQVMDIIDQEKVSASCFV